MATSGVECCNKIAEGTGGRHSFHRCRVESVLVNISCLDVWATSAPLCVEAAFSLGFVRIQEVHSVPGGDE